jgi:hypothetical protein
MRADFRRKLCLKLGDQSVHYGHETIEFAIRFLCLIKGIPGLELAPYDEP